jgi:hypothetical protein
LVVDGRAYRGIVLDLSETGVFVQTEATPAPGARLGLRLYAADGSAYAVEASVARRQVVPPRLASIARGGLGLRVDSPPPSYFELLGQSAAPRRAPAPAAPPVPTGDPYRVRVKQSDGPRSRNVEISATSPEDAAKRVLASLGRGWEVSKVERG